MNRSGSRTTTKKELVNRIADRTSHTKVVVKEILQAFLDEMIHELAQGNRLEFREFGVFEVKERKARRAQNPRTLEKVDVPAKRVVKFKVGRTMRQRVCDQPPPGLDAAEGPDATKGPEGASTAPADASAPQGEEPRPPAGSDGQSHSPF